MAICFIVPVLVTCNSTCFVELLRWRGI